MNLEDDFKPLSFSSTRDNRFDFSKHKEKLDCARDKEDVATTNLTINEKFRDIERKKLQTVSDNTRGIGFSCEKPQNKNKISLQYEDDADDDDLPAVKRVRLDNLSNRVNFVKKTSTKVRSLYSPFIETSESFQDMEKRIPHIPQEFKLQSELEMLKMDKSTASQMIEQGYKPFDDENDNMDYTLYLHSICAGSEFEMSPHQRDIFSNANLIQRKRASRYLETKFVSKGEVIKVKEFRKPEREIRKIEVSHIVLKRLGIKRAE